LIITKNTLFLKIAIADGFLRPGLAKSATAAVTTETTSASYATAAAASAVPTNCGNYFVFNNAVFTGSTISVTDTAASRPSTPGPLPSTPLPRVADVPVAANSSSSSSAVPLPETVLPEPPLFIRLPLRRSND
jgi:hypothetical protein